MNRSRLAGAVVVKPFFSPLAFIFFSFLIVVAQVATQSSGRTFFIKLSYLSAAALAVKP